MSLLRVSELRAQEASASEEEGGSLPSSSSWLLPSHVQVTVLEARGLRAKGGAPAGDAFVALQLGRQKHRTAVATQKGGCPRWAEECALELPPTAAAAPPRDPEALLLQLTVWQRALVGGDRFLGRAALPLDALLEEGGGRSHPERWYKLHSKPGKKEKDRGEIKVSLQFTRHSLTASMFDLSVKEKPRSPFRKLKDKVTGRQKYDLESASAIVPSSSGALDPDGQESFGPRGKAKPGGFFFRSRLRKSSLSRSNTSLGSDSTASSAGSLVGLGPPERMAQSPGQRHSSLSADPSGREAFPSPKLTHKRAFSDEVAQVNVRPESPSAQSWKPAREPASRSSLCINGSHVYFEEAPVKPALFSSAPPPAPLPPPPPPPPPPESLSSQQEDGPLAGQAPEPDLPPWPSSSTSSSTSSGFHRAPPKDPPRFIPSPPILAAQEEDKLSVKTIALNKQRVRARKEEALQAGSKPIQMATPVAFPSGVVRVRPHGEAPQASAASAAAAASEEKEEEEERGKRAQSGFFRRGSSLAVGAEASPNLAASASAAEAGTEESQSRSGRGGWFGRQDSKEPPQKPSAPPGLLATTDPAMDPSLLEDGGPPPSGKSQSEASPQTQSDRERPPVAKPLAEWDDSFDALATSRLRPALGGGPPESPSGATGPSEVVEAGSPQEGEGGDPCRFSGTTEEERPFGAPDLLSFVPEERGAEATRAPSGALESSAGGAPLPCGVACEEESGPEDPARAPLAAGSWPEEEQAGEDLEGEVHSAWRAERRRSSERMSAVVLGQTLEKDAVGRHPTATAAAAAAAAAAFPPSAVLFQEEGEKSVAAGSELAPPAILSLLRGRSQSASEADRGAPLLAGLRPAGTESAEVGALSPVASVLPPQETRGAADPPEVTNTQVGHEAEEEEEEEEEEEKEEEEEEEESAVILGVQEQGGAGECKAGTPPPKPPRKFTPLGLEEEPSESVWASVPEKWPGETAPCDFWEDLSERAAQTSPPGGQVGSPPRETAAPPAPRLMTGRGGGTSIQGAAEAPRPASPDGDVAKSHELSKPAASSGETQTTVKEGQAKTCPSQFSTEGLGLMGARGNTALRGDEEPGSSLWTTELVRLPKLGSFQTAKELPWQGGSGARPPCSPQAPHPSPSMMFWTALEEQQPPTPLDYPEAVVQPPGGEEGQPPSLRDGEGATAAGFPTREAPPSAPPPYRERLAVEPLPQGPQGGSTSELGLSSSWPGERMLDFKKADFWQAERGGASSPCESVALTPGNPFAPWAGPPPPPSPQNNPFVERPPDVLPSPAAALQASLAERGLSVGGPQAQVAPQGLFLAHPSEEQAAAATAATALPLCGPCQPLAFSTPSLQAAVLLKEFTFPSPVVSLVPGGGPAARHPSLALPRPGAEAEAAPVWPAETPLAEDALLQQTASPHPVKPISSSSSSTLRPEPGREEQKQEEAARTPARSAPQEKLKPTTSGSSSSSADPSSATLQLDKAETKRDASTLDPSAKYYHLTHDELMQLLLKREAQLSRKQERILELEAYIDRLLVRIMEHSPTLLQVPLGGGGEAKGAE